MFRFALPATLLVAACATRPPEIPLAEKQRGMNYACAFSRTEEIRYGSPASEQSLRKLHEHGVDWIAITPFGFQRGSDVRLGGYETDESLRGATAQAHALGMKVMLKPHVWRRDVGHTNWETWFPSYEAFITHYATLARDAGIDALSIGNELKVSTKHETEWRAVIRRVREIYPGPITYGANFDEVFHVPFWDDLDWIGVSAYFPLVDDPLPEREELVAAWKPIVDRLEALSIETGKPVLFTELGYRSAERAAWRQWELPREAALSLAAQQNAYEAFFEAVWPRPWLAGVYPWKWFSVPDHSGPRSNDYEIENKPAAEVVRRHYLSMSASSSSSRR
jgi:hypothetical protein